MEIYPEIYSVYSRFGGILDVTSVIIRLAANWLLILSENAVVFYYADCFRSII